MLAGLFLLFLAASAQAKYPFGGVADSGVGTGFLVASDHLDAPLYRGYTPDDLFDLVVRRGLHFGQKRQTGIVFHMLSALGNTGRLGLIAVGNSPEEADEIFEHAKTVLDEEARFDELE